LPAVVYVPKISKPEEPTKCNWFRVKAVSHLPHP
jgi:hypothetical protein